MGEIIVGYKNTDLSMQEQLIATSVAADLPDTLYDAQMLFIRSTGDIE